MTPKDDQIDRDCFYVSLAIIQVYIINPLALDGLLRDGKLERLSDDPPLLVHGMVDDKYQTQIRHAWVTYAGYAIDFSANNDVVVPFDTYKICQKVTTHTTFTPEQAFQNLASGNPIGYWGSPDQIPKISNSPTYEEWLSVDFHDLFQRHKRENPVPDQR
jgi:hypothetical protein